MSVQMISAKYLSRYIQLLLWIVMPELVFGWKNHNLFRLILVVETVPYHFFLGLRHYYTGIFPLSDLQQFRKLRRTPIRDGSPRVLCYYSSVSAPTHEKFLQGERATGCLNAIYRRKGGGKSSPICPRCLWATRKNCGQAGKSKALLEQRTITSLLFLPMSVPVSFKTVKGKVKAGKVDCQAYPQTCQSANIKAYPTVKFYPFQGTKVKTVFSCCYAAFAWRSSEWFIRYPLPHPFYPHNNPVN